MAKKPAVKSESDISLDNVLPAVDRKDVNWWETLTPPQQAKFPAWLYMRYSSSVNGPADMSRYYLMAVNERVNKKFNDIRKHGKLQYLLMTSASPGMGKQYHQFIPPMKGAKGSSKRVKLFEELFPNLNDLELEIMMDSNTDADVLEYLVSLGWTDKEIKSALSTKVDED